MSLIKLANVSLGYNKPILKGVNMEIEPGDFICIVGPNGSGKSTLIKSILGLIKPLKGKIIFENIAPNFIGYMPQETKVDANFPASVSEIVLSGALNKKGFLSFYDKSDILSMEKSLSLLGITSLKDKCFNQLSGGQRQKVLLARSLVSTNKMLILDEPSNNLDSKSKKELYEILKDLNENHGITVLMVTHDLDHGNLLGNKILSLREDDIFFGPTTEFIRRIHNDK